MEVHATIALFVPVDQGRFFPPALASDNKTFTRNQSPRVQGGGRGLRGGLEVGVWGGVLGYLFIRQLSHSVWVTSWTCSGAEWIGMRAW